MSLKKESTWQDVQQTSTITPEIEQFVLFVDARFMLEVSTGSISNESSAFSFREEWICGKDRGITGQSKCKRMIPLPYSIKLWPVECDQEEEAEIQSISPSSLFLSHALCLSVSIS